MEKRLQLKRGLKSQMPQLAVGEPGFATDEGRLYLGNNGGNIAMARADHTHTPTQVGLGNVNNTADANKSVNYANSADTAQKLNFHSSNECTISNGFAGGSLYVNYRGSAGTVCQGNDSRLADIFDIVIRTQAEFDALIASPNWLGAVSVCFIGNGGTLKFTKSDGKGVEIPPTVRRIKGMNSATIEVTNFIYYLMNNRGALWYKTILDVNDYEIDGINVNCTGAYSEKAYGFSSCYRLTNCIATVTALGLGSGNCFEWCEGLADCTAIGSNCGGFDGCKKLTNCASRKIVGDIHIDNFSNCTQLTNCTGNGGEYCFRDCTQLTNCTCLYDTKMYGFGGCNQLTNCIGKGSKYIFNDCAQLTNCTGNGGEHIFYDCSYLNGCKQSGTAPSIAFLGGTNTHVDTATVAAT